MPARQTEWTAEMALALPNDGNRYEVLDGVLFVSPAPTAFHQRAAFRLCVILDEYCRAHGIGEAMMSPADIEFSPHRLIQPDVFVVPPDIGGRFGSWKEVNWVVDLDARIFERWRPGDDRPEVLRASMEWHPLPSSPALEMNLDQYFTSVLG